jgi:uncharacterized membrane protein YfcA
MNTSNHAISTQSNRAIATVAGALICLVVVVAMFTAPADTGSHAVLPQDSQTRTVGGDVDFRFTAENILGLYTIGLVAGTFGGMRGMGGGVLKMSFLLLFFGGGTL